MYRQRTKLAHRVTSASSPGVTGTPPPPQGNNRWPEARSTPPPPGPQFFNPNALGPSPAASPGPPQPQQQSWQQQPQQFNTPPPVQQQQWYNQPATKPAAPSPHAPLPPSTNFNNNTSLNDSWNWGVQDQWGESDTQQKQWQQQRQQVPQQPQYQQQQVPSQQQQQQQYPNMQQGYQQQQNDAWNWNWNQGNQDAAWNWSLEDSSPSTESSNGPQQQVPNQYQQNYQPQQQDSYQYYNNTQQQYPSEPVETHHEVPKENNVDAKQENGSEVHSVACSELEFSDQVEVGKQTNLESNYSHQESEQGRESSFSENTPYSEQARGSVAYSEPGSVAYSEQARGSITYSEQGRESSLSQNVSFSEQARGSIAYSEQGRESSLSYSEQARGSVAYSEQGRDSVAYSEQGRESSLSQNAAYSEQPRGSVAYSEQGRESAAYSEQPRSSITYSELGRESSLSQNVAYSEQPRSSITYSEQGRESALEAYSEQARGSVAYSEPEQNDSLERQRQSEPEVRPDLIEDQSILEDINTQQPPDLVTDFENREIVPPESFPRYQQKQPVVPTSATLVAATIGVNLETVPDNIERPEDAVPLQPETPPPPPPPTNQGRLGVGQDDPSPWPNTIPPPENQEVATNLPPPPPMGRPSRHHATPPLPPPPSMDPVSASDRNQFLETGQLSADIPLFSRRQTIPGESRQSPEPGLRVVPGTTEPDEPLPGSQRSETIGSEFDDVRVGRRTNAEGFNVEPTQVGSEQRPNVEGLQTRPPNTRSSSESIRMGEVHETRPNVEGNQTRPPVRPQVPEPIRTVTVGNEVHETRPNVEGNQTRPPVRPTPEPIRTVTVGNEVHETRPNVEGNQTRPPVRPQVPEPIRTVTVGNEVHETRPNVEGNQNRPPVRPQVPEPIRTVTETRPYTEGNQTRPPMGPTNLRTNAEGTNVRTQPARSVLGGTEVPRTNAEGTNDDVRRVRGTNSTLATPPPRIGSQERSSAFTEVRSTPTQNRPPPETARSSGEGDNPSGSELEEGEISDLDNISSGDNDMDKDLDISTEDRSKDEGRKKSPQLVRDPEEHRPPSNDSGARRNDQRERRGGSRDRDRRSADRDRARGKPPRPQEEPKRRDRETPPRGRHRRHYDDEDSDSYHSERGERGEDRRRRYKDDPKRRSPDRRHRSSRHGRHDYYQDDYRYHGEYRRDYDERYHRGSRPSSRAGSEARRGADYESDHQSQKSHRDDRERERGHRKPPPGPSYYDKYGRYVRPDPRDPYYRDPYNYYGHYNYASSHQAAPQPTVPPMQHPEYNQYSYAYFEELRRNNPLAYAEWYRRFLATQQGPGSSVNLEGYAEEDRNSRGSVHSGQSSINEEIRYQARLQHGRSPAHSLRDYSCSPYHPPSSGLPPAAPHTPASLPPVYPHQYTYQAYHPSQAGSAANRMASPTPAPRLTPAKFSSAHASGGLCVQGRLVHILPHLPRDGQMATVFIHDIGALLVNDPVTAELRAFPGPLVRGTTHKNSVIQFCTLKIRAAEMDPLIFDRDSYILVWKLLILLLRQNGTVVGADIAELLLEDVDQEEERSRSPSPSRDTDTGHQSTQHQLTHKFRQFLLYGNTKEALDWAMKHGLWGHALFLASKMDSRTYANVMTRFANGLPLNDPLQTLYQLMSGRQPAAVTSCADEKWGDWRPHLAMILSNPTQRPELDHRAITTLGDTLASRGCLHASHFCYLLAQLEFGTHCQQPPAKLVLLGASHTSLPLEAFASCEAIQCTEVYEYACRLANPSFYLPHFQTYKFMYACRLVEHGFPMEGLQYCEEIAGALASMTHVANPALAEQVATLADALKFSDPTLEPLQGEESFYANDPLWLQQLRTLVDHTDTLTEGMADLQLSYQSMEYSPQQHQEEQLQHQDPQQSESLSAEWQEYYRQKKEWDAQQAANQQQDLDTSQQQQSIDTSSAGPESIQQAEPQPQQQQQQVPPQSDYWPSSQPIFTPSTPEPVHNGTDGDTSAQSDYWSNAGRNSFSQDQSEQPAQPTITMAGQRRQKTFSESSTGSNHKAPASPKRPAKPATSPGQQQNSGWFGGIFSKMSWKPKNQMKLPDDKNPTIVWDEARGRWVNTEGGDNDSIAEMKPPPKASSMSMTSPVSPVPTSAPSSLQHQTNGSAQPPPPAGAGYKLGKGMRKNYVNVLQQNGTAPQQGNKPAPTDIFPNLSQSSAPVNFFIPPPVAGDTEGSGEPVTQFTTPASSAPNSPPESDQDHNQQQIPMMYNPTQFTGAQNNFAYQR